MTTSFLGIACSYRAPVELIMIFSSKSRPGNGVGSEPVAIRVFFVVRTYDEPSFILTDISVGLVKLPHPLI